MNPADQAQIRHRRRRLRRLGIGIGITSIAMTCIAILLAAALSRATPAWWNDAIDLSDHSPSRASGFESLLVTELNRVRDGNRSAPGQPWQSQPWAVAMQAGDINAWLEFAAPKWAKNQGDTTWPPALQKVRVLFQDDHLLIGVQLQSGEQTQILSARLSFNIDENGALWITTSSIVVGRLPLAPAWVMRHAPAITNFYLPSQVRSFPQFSRLFAAFEGTQPLFAQATLRLADGRRVQILKLHSRENRLEIVAQTQQR